MDFSWATLNRKTFRVALLISEKSISQQRILPDIFISGNFIIIKGSVHQDNITILEVYAPNNRTLKYMKQNLIKMKEEIYKPTTVLRNLNTLFSVIRMSRRQK